MLSFSQIVNYSILLLGWDRWRGVKYYGDSYKGLSIEIPIRVMTNILTSFRLVSLFHKLIGLIYVTGLHSFSSGMTKAMKVQLDVYYINIKLIVSREE